MGGYPAPDRTGGEGLHLTLVAAEWKLYHRVRVLSITKQFDETGLDTQKGTIIWQDYYLFLTTGNTDCVVVWTGIPNQS